MQSICIYIVYQVNCFIDSLLSVIIFQDNVPTCGGYFINDIHTTPSIVSFIPQLITHNKNILYFYKVTSIRNRWICFIHPTIKASFKIQLIEFYFILVTNLTQIFHQLFIHLQPLIYSCYQHNLVNLSTITIILKLMSSLRCRIQEK